MPMITIRRAVIADAAIDLRDLDRAECAACGMVRDVVEAAIHFSDQAFAACDGGEVVALWGYAEGHDGYEVWCLTGPGVMRHRKRMLTENRAFVERMAARGMLFAWVLADYAAARRWLAWLGFRETDSVVRNDQRFFKVVRDGSSDVVGGGCCDLGGG